MRVCYQLSYILHTTIFLSISLSYTTTVLTTSSKLLPRNCTTSSKSPGLLINVVLQGVNSKGVVVLCVVFGGYELLLLSDAGTFPLPFLFCGIFSDGDFWRFAVRD